MNFAAVLLSLLVESLVTEVLTLKHQLMLYKLAFNQKSNREPHIHMQLRALDNVYMDIANICNGILLNNCVCSVQHTYIDRSDYLIINPTVVSL